MKAAKKQEAVMDMEKMMEEYKRLAVPGKQHKVLARLEGSWITKTVANVEPGKPPMESTGTCEQKMILDGHYLQQEYKGDMMGETFSGINVIGFDNHTKRYVSTWIDSMSTAIYYFRGSGSADGRTITQESSYDDPVRGPMLWRSVTRIVDDDTMKYEMFTTLKGGKETKEMEMTVTRKK
ncbi:MAG: DUF1579 domain-containing protein [Nitrospirae bacterium]|nr:DUF1579 domain-containing protein [Nitrospirota bacterium]